MKKIKLVVIALMVLVIIGIAIYYSYCIKCINNAIVLKQGCMEQLALSEQSNLRDDLTKSGIQNTRVEEIMKNIDSEIHMKEAFAENDGDNYDEYIINRNKVKAQSEAVLNNIKDAKGITGVFKLSKLFSETN